MMTEDSHPLLSIENFITEETDNHISGALKVDSISAACLHEKFIAIGFNNGFVHIYDHIGTKCKTIEKISEPVMCLGSNLSGEYIAITWRCNKILVIDISTSEEDAEFETIGIPTAICLNPLYSSSKCKSVIYAVKDMVALFTRGFLSNAHKKLIGNQRNVQTIKWSERFVVWASSLEAYVFDLEASRWIGNVSFQQELPLNENGFVSIQWRDHASFLAFNCRKVKVCNIVKRISVNKRIPQVKDIESYVIEIIQGISVDLNICGASIVNDKIAFIQIINSISSAEESLKCKITIELYVLKQNKYEKMGIETVGLTLATNQNLIQTASLPSENLCFLFFTKNIFVLKPRTFDDVIKSLLEHEYCKEAYLRVKENTGATVFAIKNIGMKYVNYLISKKEWIEASQVIPEIVKNDIRLWENMVQIFLENSQIHLIVQYIPCSIHSFISLNYYNDILASLLKHDSQLFIEYILKWPKGYYDQQLIVDLIDNLHESEKSNELLRIQAYLYTQKNDFSHGLNIYIKLKDAKVFELIVQHNLFQESSMYIPELIGIDQTLALKLFVKNSNKFSVVDLVNYFRSNEKLLNTYLAKLYFESPTLTKICIDLQIEMHAKYSRELLLPLLQDSSDYDLSHALHLCESLNYYQEYCFLAEKTGDHVRALKTYILQLNDVQGGVNFCNRIKDNDLWDKLKEYCYTDPKKIIILLANTQHPLDPVQLIQSIPVDMEFENLKDTVCKVLYDNNTKLSLMNCCRILLEADNIKMLEGLEFKLNEGCIINIYTKCYCCHETIVIENKSQAQEAVVFLCKHSFHSSCLTNRIGRDDICIACSFKYKSSKQSRLYDLTN